jgi:CRP-like cAMP-binding protein
MTLAAIDFQLLANAGFPPVRFAPGEAIFKEGDKGDKMYVIRSGEVAIERGGKVIEMLAPGGIFGEMALIDGSLPGAPPPAPRPSARWRRLPRRAFSSWCMRHRSSPSR